MFLLWLLVAVGVTNSEQPGLRYSLQSKESAFRQQKFSPRVINEYSSYNAMEIMVISVPEATVAMNVYFDLIESRQSSDCKMLSVEVYYQHGAPPLPPRQTFQNGTYTKRTSAGNLVIAMDTKEPLSKPFKCALPGQWYIGVLLPQSNGVKRISELGFGNSSTKGCSFNVGMRATLTTVKTQLFSLAGAEIIQDRLLIGQNTRYYRYQHARNSSKLTITISGCFIITVGERRRIDACPLTLSIREKGLPVEGVSVALDCYAEDLCSITIPTLKQEYSNYYVTATRMPRMSHMNVYFNISIVASSCPDPTQSEALDPGCVSVQQMFPVTTGKVLTQRFYPNQWNSTITIPTQRRQPLFFSLSIPTSHVGSMLGVHASYKPSFPYQSRSGILLCLQKDYAPYFYRNDYSDRYTMNCTGQKSYLEAGDEATSSSMFVPFPEKGTWYISIYQPQTSYQSPSGSLQLYAGIQSCINDCNNRGTCLINTKPDLVYGICSCDTSYTGWACETDVDIDTLSVVLLALSNLAFAVDVVVALRMRMFPEMTVYLFLTLMSTLYHLCKCHIVCAMDDSFLQLCDFFAIVLSLWVTLVAIANLSNHVYSATLNMVAVLVLFVAVREARQSILPFVLTVTIGFAIVVLYHVVKWCQGKPAASFSKKRWALFILPAAILIILSFLIFGLFETIDKYQYVHSVGHVFLGVGIALLLPNHRHRISHYDISRELNEETRGASVNSRTPLLVNQVRNV